MEERDGQGWLSLLTENIEYQLRHPNYDRTVEIRRFASMISTGRGQEEEVKRYRRYEKDELKQQRVNLYNPLTKYAIARPRKYWKKMARIEGVVQKFETSDEARLKDLQEQFKNFQPGKTFNEWLFDTLEYYGVTDPNAWIIYERADKRDAQNQIIETKIYPFVVPSIDAVNFDFGVDGSVDWLIARTSSLEYVVENNSRRQRLLENYYLYAPGFVVSAREVGEKTVKADGEEEVTLNVYPVTQSSQVAQRTFYVKAQPNGTTEVPGLQCGAYMDEVSGQSSVYVPWFDPAEHILLDLIRYKQFSDVVSTVHAYPKRWEFEKPCDFVSDKGECEGGYLNGIQDAEHTCPHCNGTGVPTNFTTEQESVKLIMPKDGNDLIELSKLAFTEPNQVDFVTYLDTKLENLTAAVMAAVFDTGLYQKPAATKTNTATEINAVMQGIADSLVIYGKVISRHFELCYRIASQYLEFVLSVKHSFPEDPNIQTLADEVSAFADIIASGIGYEAQEAQRSRVITKMFNSNPDLVRQIEAKYNHIPFADKTPDQSTMIVAGRAPHDRDRILWENFESIFRDILQDDPNFHLKTYDLQKQVVDAMVEQYRANILSLDTMPQVPNFNANNAPATAN